MFRIYVDGQVLYSSDYQEEEVLVFAPKCKLEYGKAGSLSFVVMPNHYLYNNIYKLTTRVNAFFAGVEIFRGRVLTATVDFYKQKTVHCEGDIAYLLDSLQPPRHATMTAAEYLQEIVYEHNIQVEPEKRFILGTVNVPGTTTARLFANTTYRDTRSAIDSELIDEFGGFLRTRREGGTTYLDYVKEYGGTNAQQLKFSLNLLDMTEDEQSTELYTVLLPTGEYQDPGVEGLPAWPLTIETANQGSKLLENLDGIARYGRIVETVHFPGVKTASALKSKAQTYFNRVYRDVRGPFTIKALDLRLLDASIEQFTLGKKFRIISPPHEVDLTLTCISITYDFENVENTELVLGEPVSGRGESGGTARTAGQPLSETVASSSKAIGTQWKYYSEGDDIAKIQAKKIELIAEDLVAKAESIQLISGDIETHGTLITQNANQISLEATKRNELEGDLTAKITVQADRITQEVSRSTAAEGTLTGKIAVEADRITAEVSRATAAEGTLSSRITQTESEIDLRVTKDGVITAINITPGTVKIDAAKLDVTGIINAGSIVVQNELSSLNARFDNLVAGTATATFLKSNTIQGVNSVLGAIITATNYVTTPTLSTTNLSVNGTYYSAKSLSVVTGFAASTLATTPVVNANGDYVNVVTGVTLNPLRTTIKYLGS